jgi:hypothetical protein
MQYDLANAIGRMPYRRRHEGISTGEMQSVRMLTAFINRMVAWTNLLPPGRFKDSLVFLTMTLFFVLLSLVLRERHGVLPVNPANKDRLTSLCVKNMH